MNMSQERKLRTHRIGANLEKAAGPRLKKFGELCVLLQRENSVTSEPKAVRSAEEKLSEFALAHEE